MILRKNNYKYNEVCIKELKEALKNISFEINDSEFMYKILLNHNKICIRN